ncbi:MAG: SMC-Scp complex subunit ScpB [Oscillospiraceae bacterium]|nr:SMC-Scp complex subunit ScpB [Oscillospiraceae bacterium]
MELNNIKGAIEGILFASGEPVSIERVAAVLGIDSHLVADTAAVLRDEYETRGAGIRLVRIENALQLCSAPEFADHIRLALESGKQPRLTQPALEVLAVIAYFQPVTKAYVEQVRGVDCSYTVSLLQTRGLIESRGRLAVPGRPTLYGTTAAFLRTFGISALDELPELPATAPREDGQLVLEPVQTEEPI